MVRSDIAGDGRSSNTRCAVCAIVLALGAAWSGQAAAQVSPFAPQTVKAPGFASIVDTSIPALPGQQDEEDCDPAPSADVARNHYSMLLASLDPGVRTGRTRSPGARAVPNEGLPVAARSASTAPAAPVAQSQETPRQWDIIVADKTLNVTMARWAAQAGWQLLWELPVDYAVEAHTRVNGSFEEAVGTVARSMESAEIPMKAVFYQGNKVLRIMAKGSE